MKTTQYTFFHDPGHGWLRVPHKMILALGIAAEISGYSYVDKDYVYLEEDCDYSRFCDAWEKYTGLKWSHAEQCRDVYQENTPIRDLPSFRSEVFCPN